MANAAEVIRYVYEVTGNAALRDIAAELLKVEGVTEETQTAVKALADEFAKGTAARDTIANYVKTSAALTEVSGKLDAAKAKVAALTTAQAASGTTSAAATREIRAAEGAVTTLARQQSTLEVQLTRSNVALQRAGIDTSALSTADQRLAAQLADVTGRLQGMAAQTERTATSAGTLSRVATSIGTAFAGAVGAVGAFAGRLAAITGIAGAVGTALGALNVGRFFSGAIESASTLEAAIAEVGAVSGATSEQLDRMKAAAEAAASSTKFTAVEAANALGELARASGDADQAIAQLPATLNLAQASGIGASEAATLLTTTITQFGLAATDATRVADLFATEANSTNDTVSKLGLAMSYVAPLAKQLGASVEETTALIGAMADQGFRGERAGTALRNVMSQLLDPTSKFSTELRSLGITSTDFNQIVVQLAAAGDKGKQALLALDSEARPAIAALVNSGGAGIAKLSEALQNAAGQAESTAATMGATFETATKRFGGALDFMRRSLVDPILAPLSEQLDGAALRIRAFVATADFQKLAASIKAFAVNGAKSIVEFVAAIDFKVALQRITGFVDAFRGFVKDVTDNASTIGKALSATGNAIGVVFNTFRTVVHAAATAIAGSVSLILRAGAALNSANFADILIAKLRGVTTVAEDMRTAADALMESAKTNYVETGEAAGALAANMDALAAAAAGTGAAGEAAAPKIGLTGEAAEQAAARALHAADGFDYLTGKGTALGNELGLIPDYLRPFGLAMDNAAASTKKVADDADAAKEKARALTGALSDLGITSQAELRKAAQTAANAVEAVTAARKAGGAEIEDVIRGVQKWAEAERAASELSSASVKAATERKIEAKIAALGLTQQMTELGVVGSAAGKAVGDGMFHAKAGVDGLRSAASEAQTAIVAMAQNSATTVGDLVYELNKANTSYDELGEAGKAAFDKVAKSQSDGAGGVSGAIASMINDWSSYFSGVSEGAATAFQAVLQSSLSAADGSSLALGRYLRKLSDGATDLKARIAAQQDQVVQLTEGYETFGSRAGSAVDAVAGSLDINLRRLEVARQNLKLLDDASLAKLDTAIAGVRGKMEALKESARSAKEQLATLAEDLQNDLDQQDGKAAAVEQRRFERQKAQIDELAKANGVAGSAEHQRAVANAKAIHERKMADIKVEAAAAAATQRTAQASTEAATAANATADGYTRAAAAAERTADAAVRAAAASPGSTTASSVTTSTVVNRLEIVLKDELGDHQFTQREVDQLMPKVIEAIRRSLGTSGVQV